DGRRVAVADRNNHLALHEINGAAPRPLGGIDVTGPSTVTFDRTGTHLAIGRWDGTVEVWDVAGTPSQTAVFDGGVGHVTVLVFLPEESLPGLGLVAGGFDGMARWRLAPAVAPMPTDRVLEDVVVADIAVDDERELIAAADNVGAVSLWSNGADGLGQVAAVDIEAATRAVAFDTPSSRLMIGLDNGQIVVVSVADAHAPRRLGTLSGHGEAVNDLAVGPDGLLVSASNDHSATLWRADSAAMARYVCATSRSRLTPDQWRQHIQEVPFRQTCDS
ncbi:WD40 repeat domain-containing protein, partial [Frankia sp. EI5c]|uniref:WD40 repeat domain-containing protein n=1 Tax=Frankia sp. EI5c TaxID=683316 RepID=UPI001A7E7271